MDNELILANDAIRKREELHRTILRASMDGFWRVDLEGRLLEVNDAYCKMIGYSQPELLAMSVADLEAVEQREPTAAHIARIIERGEDRFETCHRRKDGSIFAVEVSGRYFALEGGRIIIFLRDLTELRQAERERQQFFKFFQTSTDLMCIADPTGNFFKTNPAFSETLGFSEEEFVSKPFMEFIHPDDKQGTLDEMAMQLQRGYSCNFRNRYICKNGSVKWLSWRVTCNKGDGIAYGTARDITDIKRAEESLRRTEQKLRHIVENSTNLFYMHTTDNLLTYVSPQSWQFFDCAPEEAMVRWTELITDNPLNRAGVESTQQAINTGERQPPYLVECIGKKGRKIWVEVNEAPIIENGWTVSIVGALTDITERIRAEETLRASRNLLHSILENVPIRVFWKDLESRYLGCNTAFARDAGLSQPEELLGKDDFQMGWREQADLYRADDKRVMESGTPKIGIEEPQTTPGGQTICLRTSKVPLRDAENKVIGMLGVYEDITQRKQAEEALRESENRLRFALEGSNDGLWDVQVQTNTTYLSPRGWEILGYLPGEDGAVINDWSDLVHPEDLPLTNERLQEHIEGRTPIFQVEQRLRMKSGEWKWVLTRGKVVARYTDGKPFRITGTHTDLTEQKILQEQLIQAQKMESVGRLAGGVAHDFNNMLSVILGYAQLALKSEAILPPLREYCEQILKAAERSADIVRQLLAFARKQTVTPKVLDLNETISGMLKMLRRLIGEDIDLAWLPGEGVWPVKMDAAQIDQILVNLCVNARDSIAGIGRISIETGNKTCDAVFCNRHTGCIPGEYALFSVCDDGCGMDQETIRKIFEPFFTTKGMGQGTGLGLATVYGIVKQNDGFIYVDTEPGQGTNFKIYLPRYQGKDQQARTESPIGLAGRGKETVLMVEDEPAILDLGKRVLEMQGYRVLIAGTPGEAIRIAIEHVGEIHLLLTDVIMPEMNGRELAKRLLSLYPGLKRLFMSGYTADVIVHRGVLDEGVQFIQKPFSLDALAAKVRESLDQ